MTQANTLKKYTKDELIQHIISLRNSLKESRIDRDLAQRKLDKFARINRKADAAMIWENYDRGDHLIDRDGCKWQVLHIKGCDAGYAKLIDETDGSLHVKSLEYMEKV